VWNIKYLHHQVIKIRLIPFKTDSTLKSHYALPFNFTAPTHFFIDLDMYILDTIKLFLVFLALLFQNSREKFEMHSIKLFNIAIKNYKKSE